MIHVLGKAFLGCPRTIITKLFREPGDVLPCRCHSPGVSRSNGKWEGHQVLTFKGLKD